MVYDINDEIVNANKNTRIIMEGMKAEYPRRKVEITSAQIDTSKASWTKFNSLTVLTFDKYRKQCIKI